MKFIVFAVCLFAPSLALAQGRPDARHLSCAHARAMVMSQGAVVIGSGPYIYDRYVSSGQYCVRPEVTLPTWITTADAANCFVGYVCGDRPNS